MKNAWHCDRRFDQCVENFSGTCCAAYIASVVWLTIIPTRLLRQQTRPAACSDTVVVAGALERSEILYNGLTRFNAEQTKLSSPARKH